MSGETVFSRAADLIREHGWHQHDAFGPGGQMCVMQALGEAAKQTFTDGSYRTLRTRVGHTFVSEWNDAPERTVEDVLMVLKELHVEAGGS